MYWETVRGSGMTLSSTEKRCNGGTEAAPCAIKDECARYTDRLNIGSRWISVTLRACAKTENFIESKA